MNKISNRAWVIVVLALVLAVGVSVFAVRYFADAEDWVKFPGSPHLYSGANPNTGTVIDRNGTLLLDATQDRTYSTDLSLRCATIHLLGDRFGYIDAPILGHFLNELVGYNPVNGLYGKKSETRTAALTLSANAQKTAYELLKGKRGTVGVYNYKTGEILCAVSTPSYDPDHMPDVENDTTGAYEGVYVNRFLGSTYTPGSIFKTLTTAAALETVPGIADMRFSCEGSCIVDGERITCNGVHGDQSLEQALCNSCNCAYAQIAQLVGGDVLQQYVTQIGVCDALSFDGTKTVKGKFDLTDASNGSVCWAGIGQYTDLVNPCRFMVYMGMLANGGKAAQPYLMASVFSEKQTAYSAKTVMLDSGLKASTTEQLAVMMRNNVVTGYGAWQFPNLFVCGKSGTAETSEGKPSNAMFAGFIQDAEYPLAFVVVVEEGGSGSGTAAPIAGKVLQACVDDLSSNK